VEAAKKRHGKRLKTKDVDAKGKRVIAGRRPNLLIWNSELEFHQSREEGEMNQGHGEKKNTGWRGIYCCGKRKTGKTQKKKVPMEKSRSRKKDGSRV